MREMRSSHYAEGGVGPCYLAFNGSGADPVVLIGDVRRNRRRRRVVVAGIGAFAGVGLLCFGLLARPENARKDYLEEVPIAAAPAEWHPYDYRHRWKGYTPDHNVFDYMVGCTFLFLCLMVHRCSIAP